MKTPRNRRFNEFPSPPVRNRKLQAYQLLCLFNRRFPQTAREACEEIGMERYDFDELRESMFDGLVAEGAIEECGSCGHYHRPDFQGDCRNDDERFPS